MSVRALALRALVETDPARKCQQVLDLQVGCPDDSLTAEADYRFDPAGVPGRPSTPELVHPRDVPQRGLGTQSGRIALLHAVAHIEFNAINLALDAICRFDAMPAAFYSDWLSVARDEARHFGMLRARLQQLGSDYGQHPAHNGLWEAAEKTAHDVLVRMALVPRVLEARGLDVTPGIIDRLRGSGDEASIVILEIILREEVRHVAVGTRWFRHLCAGRGLDPTTTFLALLAEYDMRLRPPFNRPARQAAGFLDAEMPA